MIELGNLSLESRLLTSLVDINSTYDKYYSQLNPDLFYRIENKKIFNTIVKLKKDNPLQDLGWVIVCDELKVSNELKSFEGGEQYINKLMSEANLVFGDNLDNVITRLQDYKNKRVLKTACDVAIHEIAEGVNVADVTNNLLSVLSNNQQANNEIILHTFESLLANKVDEINNYEDIIQYYYLGFVELTRRIKLRSDSLLVLAGRPAMGKTSMGMNMVTAIAQTNLDKTALVFSLEMKAEYIADRALSSEGEIDPESIVGGRQPTENEWAKISDTIAKLKDLPVTIIDKNGITIQEVRSQCHRVKREYKKDLSVIMVDYLTFMGGIDGIDRVNKIGEITRALKGLAQEYNCPVILLAQLNRDLEKRPDRRPLASDLRDSGAIEQDADVVAMLYRDEVYNEKTEMQGIAEVIIRKNRFGDTGTVKLGFDGKYTKFTEIIPDIPFDDD